MKTRYSCSLNGYALDDISDKIYITDISESSPKYDLETFDNPVFGGQFVAARRRRLLEIRIKFQINEQDVIRRKTICSKCAEWAENGGYLALNDRPGQTIKVVCSTVPIVDSALKFSNDITIGFTAYSMPYWMDAQDRKTTFTGSGSTTKKIETLGNAGCAFVFCSITNKSSTVINTLTVKTPISKLAFSSLGLNSGETLQIGYDEHFLLYANVGDEGKLKCRTQSSTDDLLMDHGKMNNLNITCEQAYEVTAYARGLYY